MDILLACMLTIFIFITCYFLICKVFITLFTLTGLKHSVAKFQVFSLFFAVGYTSGESELILCDKLRRKIATCCMVFGAVLNIILTALTIGVITSLDFSGNQGTTYLLRILTVLLIGIGTFVCVYMITKIKFLREKTYNLLEAILYRKTVRGNVIQVGDIIHDKHLVSVKINKVPAHLANKKLSETELTKSGVIVLSILDCQNNVVQPTADTTITTGCTLELFGSYRKIYDIFSKR